MHKELSVVIPVYRSAATLHALTDRLVAVLEARAVDYEIIFVDDGSPDDSWQVLRHVQAARPERVLAIQLMRNFGQHNALMCGFHHARGEIIITLDDDLQNPPEEILKLLDALRSGQLDVVYGCYATKEHPLWRNLGSRLGNAFYRLVFRSPAAVTSFRAIRREVLENILAYSLNYTFIDGLLAWTTQRIGQTPVQHRPRQSGRSGYSLGKLASLAVTAFTNFSLLPLRWISVCGFACAGLGLLASVYYLIQYLLARIIVPGYASLMIAILVLGGVQLLALGIMAEYLGRLHMNINRKPQYVEREVLGGPNDGSKSSMLRNVG